MSTDEQEELSLNTSVAHLNSHGHPNNPEWKHTHAHPESYQDGISRITV